MDPTWREKQIMKLVGLHGTEAFLLEVLYSPITQIVLMLFPHVSTNLLIRSMVATAGCAAVCASYPNTWAR